MASFVNAIGDFFKAIFELFAAFFSTLFHLVQTLLNAVGNFFAGIVHLVASTVKGTAEVAGETGKFLIGNALIIIVIAAGVVGFLRYQKSQGKPVVVGGKKLN